MLPLFMCVCCLTQYYSVQPFMLLLLWSALYSVQPQLYNVYPIGVPSCFVYCCLTQLSLCSLSQCCCFCFCPVSQRSIRLFLTRYANFVYLGFRRSLAYLHLSAASPHSSVAIGGNCVCVCVLSSLVCTCTGCS